MKAGSETAVQRVLIVCGTRPEVIKLAPVHSSVERTEGLKSILCATGQHTDMADQTFAAFGIAPDITLAPRSSDSRSLPSLLAHLTVELERIINEVSPRLVVVQGDTASALAGALAAFSLQVPVAHVEAGLRSFDLADPFPEEGYRAMIAQVATLQFAPTCRAADNLLCAGVPGERVFVTGNTVTDAALELSGRLEGWPDMLPCVPEQSPVILVTAHRRESWGTGLATICRAIASLHEELEDVHFLFPVHLNPKVKDTVMTMLEGYDRVHLMPPLSYECFIPALRRARLVLTDSGGIQEEAPTFGVPTLVMRSVTERPEAVEAGLAELVGTDHDKIVNAALRLMRDPDAYYAMARTANPFGDGKAGERIGRAIRRCLSGERPLLSLEESFVPTWVNRGKPPEADLVATRVASLSADVSS